MMYLPKLFAYASLILLMFEKMTFTQISHNFLLSVFMDLPFQKVKKNIVWGKIETRVIDIFFLYINSSTFFLAGNQFIFCKEEVVATYI